MQGWVSNRLYQVFAGLPVSPKIRWKIERDNSSNLQDKIEDRNRWTSAFLLILHESILQDILSLYWIQHTFIYEPYRHCLQDGYMTVIYKTVTYINNYPRQLTTRPTTQDGFFLSCTFSPHVSHTLSPFFSCHHVSLHVQFRIRFTGNGYTKCKFNLVH